MYRCFYGFFIVFSLAVVCPSRAEEPSSNFGLLQLNKEVALKKLLEQFSYEDWRDWKNSYVSSRGTPTIAKYYLERVALVDKELAKYLEASAQLFHRLYFRTRKGEVFDFDAELARLESKTSSEAIEQLRSDQIAKSFIENLRYEFILKYVQQNPFSSKNLKLFASLSANEIDQRLYPGLIGTIDRLSVKASPSYRKTFFENESLLAAIKTLAGKDLASKRALANLFLLGAVDALEENEKAWAAHLFKQSQEAYPNFALQLEVARFLDVPQSKVTELQAEEVAPKDAKNTKFTLFKENKTKSKPALPSNDQPAESTSKNSGNSFSFLFFLILILLAVASVVVIILYKRYVEFQRYKIKQKSSTSKEDAKNLETIPGLDEFSSAKVSNL